MVEGEYETAKANHLSIAINRIEKEQLTQRFLQMHFLWGIEVLELQYVVDAKTLEGEHDLQQYKGENVQPAQL